MLLVEAAPLSGAAELVQRAGAAGLWEVDRPPCRASCRQAANSRGCAAVAALAIRVCALMHTEAVL